MDDMAGLPMDPQPNAISSSMINSSSDVEGENRNLQKHSQQNVRTPQSPNKVGEVKKWRNTADSIDECKDRRMSVDESSVVAAPIDFSLDE